MLAIVGRTQKPKYNSLIKSRNKEYVVVIVAGIVVLFLIAFSLYWSVSSSSKYNTKRNDPQEPQFSKAVVAADSAICSRVGKSILKKNGSAVDAAIATMFCSGVVHMHSCGIGGGGFMLVYIREEKKIHALDYRGVAPALARKNMFSKNQNLSESGGLSIAVPGELKGLWEAHKRFGRLPWSELIAPAIKLAEEGFLVPLPMQGYINRYIIEQLKVPSEGLRELFINADGSVKNVTDILVNKELAKTLKLIQKEGGDTFYSGRLSKMVLEDMKNVSGIISATDLKRFQVKYRRPVNMKLEKNLTFHSMSAPGSGMAVAMILNIMQGYDFTKYKDSDINDVIDFTQKFIESMKFSFAQRALFGDPDFANKTNLEKVIQMMTDRVTGSNIRNQITLNKTHDPSYYGGYWAKDDFGTSHVSIVAENGDAVAVTSTINFGFGSLYRSKRTGILYNNNMNDFSTPNQMNLYGLPPTPNNFIEAFKTPLSSMSPTIVTDRNGEVKIVIGASGGSRIISAVAMVILKKMKLKMSLEDAVSSWRVHHQCVPNVVTYLNKIPPPNDVLGGLLNIGHEIVRKPSISVVQVIWRENGRLEAMCDPRKHGTPFGY